jgi:hypothetical protein
MYASDFHATYTAAVAAYEAAQTVADTAIAAVSDSGERTAVSDAVEALVAAADAVADAVRSRPNGGSKSKCPSFRVRPFGQMQ